MKLVWRFAPVPIGLLLLGGVAAAQETPTIAPATIIEVQYGAETYDVRPEDGPVIACVVSVNLTAAGVDVAGIVIVQDGPDRFRVATPFSAPASAMLANARPDDCYALDVPTLGDATLGGGRAVRP